MLFCLSFSSLIWYKSLDKFYVIEKILLAFYYGKTRLVFWPLQECAVRRGKKGEGGGGGGEVVFIEIQCVSGQIIYGKYNTRKGGVSKKCNHECVFLELMNANICLYFS